MIQRVNKSVTSLYQYSEFFWTFTWRNIRLQYNSFALGLFWGLIQPLLMSAIFYVALNNTVGVNFPHYFLYIYSGFIFWSAFSGGLSQALIGFLQNDKMVKQIYFPRFLLPLTFISAKMIDLLLALGVLVVVILFSDLEVAVFPFIIYTLLGTIQLLLVSIGFNLSFSVICVRHRGFQVIYPFVAQAIFFTSSVIYDVSLSVENEWLKPFFKVNPISMILSTFRAGVFPQDMAVGAHFSVTLYALLICLLGYGWFRIEDKHLIDRM